MKKAVNMWAFPEGYTPEACMRLAKRAGFDGFEPAFGERGRISPESRDAELREYRTFAEDLGIEIASLACGLYWHYPLTAEDPAVRKKSADIVRKQLRAARLLGTDCILVVPGLVGADFVPEQSPVPYDLAYERALNGLRALAPYAEDLGVTIGLENVWNKFLLSPLEMRAFIDAVDSPRVQAYFDIGNVLLTGYPEHWIPLLGPRIVRCHCKDYRVSAGTAAGFVDLLAGDVHYPAVMEALKAVGYNGYMTAELNAYRHYSDHMIFSASAAMDRILGIVKEERG